MNRLRNEPAVVIGALVSILSFVLEAVKDEPSWRSALPALVGAVVRRFVTPV